MERTTLSRMIACDYCGDGISDSEMRVVYHLEGNDEVQDGVVHATCEAAFISCLENQDPGYQDFPSGGNDGDSAFCDNYEVHDAHSYRALNGINYYCYGLTAEDLAKIEAEANQPPCEHGLSASLCAGPMHYPADF